ncbi:IncQ-type mobilization protein MobB, partial [Aeromonas caviae]|uniref:IncQ-type mobilization protein MobB n=1 Tax=Aeromonas caviae TaxID=648 RepID=UPI003AF3A765
MSAIDKIKNSRNIKELAEGIEPLAQSLATLADDLRTVIGETQTASNEQAGIWATGQRESAKAWKDAAKDM